MFFSKAGDAAILSFPRMEAPEAAKEAIFTWRARLGWQALE